MELTEFEEKLDAKVKERFLESVPRYYEHTLQVVDNMKSIPDVAPRGSLPS